MIFGGEWWCVG